jgi:hypothetical protein
LSGNVTVAKNAGPISLVCDNGQTFSAVTKAVTATRGRSGPRTTSPAPLCWYPFLSGPSRAPSPTARAPSSNSLHRPSRHQGQLARGGQHADQLHLHVQQHFHGDPNRRRSAPGTYTFTGSGSVTGFIPSQK